MARSFCRPFFDWYNHRHRHSGIGLMTRRRPLRSGRSAPRTSCARAGCRLRSRSRSLRTRRALSARAPDHRLDQPTEHSGGCSLISSADCLTHLDRLRPLTRVRVASARIRLQGFRNVCVIPNYALLPIPERLGLGEKRPSRGSYVVRGACVPWRALDCSRSNATIIANLTMPRRKRDRNPARPADAYTKTGALYPGYVIFPGRGITTAPTTPGIANKPWRSSLCSCVWRELSHTNAMISL